MYDRHVTVPQGAARADHPFLKCIFHRLAGIVRAKAWATSSREGCRWLSVGKPGRLIGV